MYGFSEIHKCGGAELNPRLPQELRTAMEELLAKVGNGSGKVVADFLNCLSSGQIQVTYFGFSERSRSGCAYDAVQIPGFDIGVADTGGFLSQAWRKPDALPLNLRLGLYHSLASDEAIRPVVVESARVLLDLNPNQVRSLCPA